MPPARYDEPFHWWGPGWQTPPCRDLADLLRDGTLDVATAAQLWAALARRESLTIIGGPSGLGKSTLLQALCELLPARTRRLYLRGCFEPFAFLGDPRIVPGSSAMVINEISPHLPVYLWGSGVSRALDAARTGFMLLATAHGASVIEFVASLTGSPLRIPAAQVAACGQVALLEPAPETASGRQVSGIWRLRATSRGLDMARVGASGTSTVAALELDERRALLTQWRDGQIAALPEVAAVAEAPAVVGAAPSSDGRLEPLS